MRKNYSIEYPKFYKILNEDIHWNRKLLIKEYERIYGIIKGDLKTDKIPPLKILVNEKERNCWTGRCFAGFGNKNHNHIIIRLSYNISLYLAYALILHEITHATGEDGHKKEYKSMYFKFCKQVYGIDLVDIGPMSYIDFQLAFKIRKKLSK